MPLATDLAPRLNAILPILACPKCMGQLHASEGNLRCAQCSRVYPVRGDVPVLLPENMQEPGVGTVSADDPVSRHPYSPAALDIIRAHPNGWILDLGAGGKLTRFENVVQIDIFRYPMTDVVGTADRLPFRDNAFRAVVSQAVFEHLQYPEWAAAEIRRVLQPHGIAKIDTAFLQPEHGYPHHYYNASETGLRHWFREFDIQWSGVEPYQHPKWSLSWFLSVYLDRVDAAAAALLRGTTLEALIGALQRSGELHRTASDSRVLAALDALPTHAQRILAAGVSVHVINRPKTAGNSRQMPERDSAASHGDFNVETRKTLAAREEIEVIHQRNCALHEQQIVMMDRTRYLAQFYPGRTSLAHLGPRAWIQFQLVALLRTVLPRSAWFRLRYAVMQRSRHGAALRAAKSPLPRPFLSVIVAPNDPLALINTFFSLVRQTYTGWELILLESVKQTPALTQCLADFSMLDERVRVVPAASAESDPPHGAAAHGRGEFCVRIPEGTMMTFDAIRHCVTLARNRHGTRYILADFERGELERTDPVRCYNSSALIHEHQLALLRPWFVLCSNTASSDAAELSDVEGPLSSEIAYIPKVLFRFVPAEQCKTS